MPDSALLVISASIHCSANVWFDFDSYSSPVLPEVRSLSLARILGLTLDSVIEDAFQPDSFATENVADHSLLKGKSMEKWLGKYSSFLYALMRIVSGLMFACHGAQKLFGVLGGTKQTETLMLAAGIIEFVGGLLIAVGLFTSYAAFIASGQMAVAYFTRHSSEGFWPIENKGELAVLYCFVFLYIASRGSGILSLDALFGKARRR